MQAVHKFVILSEALAESKDLRTGKSVRSCHHLGIFLILVRRSLDSALWAALGMTGLFLILTNTWLNR